MRECRAERIDPLAVAGNGKRRAVAGDDRTPADRRARMARIARIGVERRAVDNDEPELAPGEQGEERDKKRSQARQGAIGQLASPTGVARSRSSV